MMTTEPRDGTPTTRSATTVLGKEIRILLFGSSIWYLGEGMLGPIFGVFTTSIGGSILDISWIWAAYLIATGVFTVIVGKISDARYSKEKLLVTGYALNTLFTFGYLFATTPQRLLFVQVGLGLASALATPTWDALYSRYHDKALSGFVWGLSSGQAQFVTGIAVIVGGLIVNYYSFALLFISMGVVQLFATLYQAQILFMDDGTSKAAGAFYASDTPGPSLSSPVYHLVYHQPHHAAQIVTHSITIKFKDQQGRIVDVLYAHEETVRAAHVEAAASARDFPLVTQNHELSTRTA